MAKRYILVPEELYRGLINDADSNVIRAKRKAEATLHDPNLSSSAKNLLYNKDLKNFLKIRKEVAEKPIKVNLSEPQKEKVIFKTSVQTQVSDRPKKPASSRRLAVADVSENREAAEDVAASKSPSRKRQKPTPSQDSESTANRLREYIMSNIEKFPVTEHGRIHNVKGRNVSASSLEAVTDYLTNPSRHHYPPPGARELFEQLKNDENAMVFVRANPFDDLDETETDITAPGGSQFRPQVWNF